MSTMINTLQKNDSVDYSDEEREIESDVIDESIPNTTALKCLSLNDVNELQNNFITKKAELTRNEKLIVNRFGITSGLNTIFS